MIDDEIKEIIKIILFALVSTAIVIFILLWIYYPVDNCHNKRIYNKGVCQKDGTSWNYFGCDYYNQSCKYYICGNKHIVKLTRNYG